jgi:hypothetical protein
MRLAREYSTPIDYFLSLPLDELGEVIREHQRIAEEAKGADG